MNNGNNNTNNKSALNSRDDFYKNKDKDNKARKNKKSIISLWALQIFFLTFALSLSFSILSEVLVAGSNVIFAFILLAVLILTNIIFDIVGVAVTTCSIEPFLSMAAKKIKSAKTAVKLIKNAEKVNNICSDVIGDICGIVTGALGASIVLNVFSQNGANPDTMIASIMFSSIIAAVTVGGKAIGKKIAMVSSQRIVFFVAKILSLFSGNKK